MKKNFLFAFAVLGLCACPPSPAPMADDSGPIVAVADADSMPAPIDERRRRDAGTLDSGAPQPGPPHPPAPCVDSAGIHHLPDPMVTPGFLCTATDPNFDGFRYPSHVAHCARNISGAEKDQVAQAYGIPKSDYSKYEFDHFIPLNAGGSDDPRNLWPQPLGEAHEKDKVEDQVYYGLKNGTMTQDVAVAKIRAWRPAGCVTP